MNYKQKIAKYLTKFELEENNVLMLIQDADLKNGDFALPVFKIAASLKQNPMQFAIDLANKINENKSNWLDKAMPAGGYVNFYFKRQVFIKDTFDYLCKKTKGDGEYKNLVPAAKKTIAIDYSSINIAKDFHIGHLLTTVIGGSLCEIFSYLGHKVVGINHLGDWGTQFGKLIYAVKTWGEDKPINSMEELTALYVKYHNEADKDKSLDDKAREWFKKIEDADKEALKLFNEFKRITLKEVNKIYDMLGIKFDSYDGESFFNDKMGIVIDTLKEKKLLVESDKAFVVEMGENEPPCMILKSDGATLYATRDLAAAIYRKKTYDFDENLYVVAYQQNLHFKQVFKVLELMGYDWADRCKHIAFGMVSLEGGEALSTRKGNVVLLKDVLKTSVDKTMQIIKDRGLEDKDRIAHEVGVGAVVFFALYNQRIKDMVFSFDKALNFDGETGPYLQYTHARCCSLVNKFDCNFDIEAKYLEDDFAYEVIRLLSRFDDIVLDAAYKYEPSIIARYLIDLCQCFNRFYFEKKILGQEEGVTKARMGIVKLVKNALKNGMKLIKMNAPNKM
ncbi:MAG: arginine--tRNA ligase [Firmicutes bacterium]|nr:arginine--tRNA ligase [Bacillota bacterium]